MAIEKDEHGSHAWRPELKGLTLEEVMVNIKEAAELYLETLPIEKRDFLLSREFRRQP